MIVLPCFTTVAVPVYVVPPQQKRYAPVWLLPMKTVPGFESSCKQTLNTPTLKLHVAVLPDISVAVQVTVVVPIAKQLPLGGVQTTATPGQLSEAVAVKLTTEQVAFTFGVTTVWLAGQVTTGAWVSTTVTVNVQLPVCIASSVEEQVTVVTPLGKNEPLAGEHVTGPGVAQGLVAPGVTYVVTAPH